MSGRRLDELNLGSDKIAGLTEDELPEQMGQFADPPQPGPYRFRFPADMTGLFDTIQVHESDNPDVEVTRLNVIFDAESPLEIVQSPGGTENGTPFQCRISNVRRKRGKEGPLASDWDYILAMGFKVALPATRDNAWYGAQIAALGGKEFGADVEFTWYCNAKKDIYAQDADGSVQQVEGKKGCGSRYYMSQVDKVDGAYPVRIDCGNVECGASLRAFPQLGRFRE